VTSFTLKDTSLPVLADRIRLLSIGLIVLFGIEGIFAVLASDPATPPTASSTMAARLTTLGLYLLVALLFVAPLWRYVQWTFDVSRSTPAARLDQSGIRLEKWIGALRILNIFGLAFFGIGLIVLLSTFRLDGIHVIALLSLAAQIAYVLLAAQMFASTLIYMAAVRNRTATLSASSLQRQVFQAMILTALVWVLSVIQEALVDVNWPSLIVGFTGMLVTLALMWVSRQFIGQTAIQDSLNHRE
jgi:hypothetical protein